MNYGFTLVLFVLALHLHFAVHASNPFSPPVKRTMKLSGTYGELRPGHFHSGIDIKSKNGRAGEDIYASANGHISRIRVSAVGYGNVIYIDHPNGYTTVYAHLDAFSEDLQKWVAEYQKRHQTFEIDIRPSKNQLPICKDEIIGSMGNSGSSFGVHLHYEIRHTQTETPLNPLKWNWDYTDDAAPHIQDLYIYHLDEEHLCIEQSKKPCWGPTTDRRINSKPILTPVGKVAFGIKSYDPFNRWRNKNGIAKIELSTNHGNNLSIQFDSIAFAENRFFEQHIDYETYCEYKSFVHRLFKNQDNRLTIYKPHDFNGITSIHHGDTIHYEIKILDMTEKYSKLSFVLVGDSTLNPSTNADPIQEQNEITTREVCIEREEDWLEALQIDDDCHPFTNAEMVESSIEKYPDSLHSKLFLAEISSTPFKDMGGWIEDGHLHAQVMQSGVFAIAIDTLPPKFELKYASIRPGGKIQGRLKNELKSTFRHIDLTYVVSCRDRYIPHSYDKKRNLLTINIPKDWDTSQTIELELRDRLNNMKVYSFNYGK